MSYVSGTATNMGDLLTQVKAFLAAEGWTIERFDASSIEVTRVFTRGGGPVSRGFGIGFLNNAELWNSGTGSAIMCVPWTQFIAIGYVWYNQTGHPLTASSSKILGVSAPCATTNIPYHCFSEDSGEVITIVVGLTANIFNYLGFGMLRDTDKVGSWNGWQYAFGSRDLREDDSSIFKTNSNVFQGISIPPLPPGYLRYSADRAASLFTVDSDGSGEEWRSNSRVDGNAVYRTTRVVSGHIHEVSGTRDTNIVSIGGLPSYLPLWVRSRSGLANNIVVLPCLVSAYRTATQRWSPLLRIPQVRACWTSGALNEGAQFLIGSDAYRAFNSFAVKEVP